MTLISMIPLMIKVKKINDDLPFLKKKDNNISDNNNFNLVLQ